METYKKQVVSFLLLLFIAAGVEADPMERDSDDANAGARQRNSETPGQASATSPRGEMPTAGDEPPQTSGIERMVMPLTHWVEEKIQNTSIIKPSAYSRKRQAQGPNHINLREAIERAQKQYTGTVLGAERISEKDQLIYRIKILSASGIVKLVEVDGSKQESEGTQHEVTTD